MQKLTAILFAAALAVGGYAYREKVTKIYAQMHAQFLPCKSIITYSLGTVDKKFGLSNEQLLKTIERAEAVWEKPTGRDLFKAVGEKGVVTIRFVYDYRQEAVNTLTKLGISIDANRATYDSLRVRYDSMQDSFDRQKASFEAGIAQLARDQDAYNAEVQMWNARGGAPKDVYQKLEETKARLLAKRSSLESAQAQMNASVDTINALATTLNRIAHNLNIQAENYNAVGASTGGEFEEGVYTSALGEQAIEIYEFGDEEELVRVLAHELGHALGLEHVSDKDAIMYELNQSKNGRATAADIKEFERVCGAK